MDIEKLGKYIGKLKQTKRSGWVREKIPNSESVADHSFGAALLALMLAKKNVDQSKVVKMLLIHDIGEAITGDIVTDHGKNVDEKLLKSKTKNEMKAIEEIFSNSKEFVSLFNEFEMGKTPEARLAKQLDKLEMIVQAHYYEKIYKINLEEFYQTGFARIKDKKLKKILKNLYSKRA